MAMELVCYLHELELATTAELYYSDDHFHFRFHFLISNFSFLISPFLLLVQPHPSYPSIWAYVMHVTLDPRLPLFSLTCVEKDRGAWGRGYPQGWKEATCTVTPRSSKARQWTEQGRWRDWWFLQLCLMRMHWGLIDVHTVYSTRHTTFYLYVKSCYT